jgi:hypothetical protein
MLAFAGLRPRVATRLLAAAAFLTALPLCAAHADKVLRVGMTASDIPTTGQQWRRGLPISRLSGL